MDKWFLFDEFLLNREKSKKLDEKFSSNKYLEDECMIYFLESIRTRRDTKKIIIQIITDFGDYTGKSPTELVGEASDDHISLKQRKIKVKNELFAYKKNLEMNSNDSIQVKDALKTIKSFYRVFGIELAGKYVEIKLKSVEEKVAIQKQVISEFPDVYLELISIIQAAILGYLLILIYTNLDKITLWIGILILNVFILNVIIWHEYVMMSSAWRWIPKFKDALIPFVVGISEFIITTFIFISDFQYWFYGFGVFGIISFLTYYTNFNSAKKFQENEYVIRVSGNYYPNTYVMYLLSGIIFIGAGLIIQFISSSMAIKYFFALLALVVLSMTIYRSHLFWKRLLD